jgi:hypothetical protein
MTHNIDGAYLVAEYRTGRSVASLSRELRVDPSAIRARLVRSHEPIRGAREATAANLRHDPSILDRMGRARVYPVNVAYFDALSANCSYIIGLLQADGSNDTIRNRIRITLKASDGVLLEDVAKEMGAPRPLFSDKYGNPCLDINSRGLSAGLASWGVVSPKSHTASTHLSLLDNRDYWRGVVDGDGTLCVAADGRRILSLVGSRFICAEFLAFCQARGAGMRRTARPHKSIWSVHLSGSDAEWIATALYSEAGLALQRKRATADTWDGSSA